MSARLGIQGEIERRLARAEDGVRLLDRAAASNLPAERARLVRELGTGGPLVPAPALASAPDLTELRRELTALARALEAGDALERLYAERALELEREAALAEALGSPRLAALARRHFAPDPTPAQRAQIDALVQCWLAQPISGESEARIASDDERDPRSLISVLRRRIGALRIAVRVELRAGLPSVAAAGSDFVAIRPKVALRPSQSERIARHELEAHVLPRLFARRERIGVFRVGAARGFEQEEGRALLVERRADLLDGPRRRELALRHVAAESAHDAAPFAQTTRALLALGAAPDFAVDAALRAHRGGGLGREIVYLPAYLELDAAFRAEPELERYFERGRVSLAAARVIARLEAGAQPISTTTGA